MAKIKIVLDLRTKLSDDKYNLTVRITHKGDVMYLNVSKMTKAQYNLVFIKKSGEPKSIEFRETCNKYITKCERIFSKMKVYNRKRFRELFYEKDKEIPTSLLLKDLFTNFNETYGLEHLKIRTRAHVKMTMQTFENYKPGLSVSDITSDFLQKFERDKLKLGWSQSSIDSNLRDLRRLINYYSNEVKLIPRDYEYPFGKGGGYSLKSSWPKKIVMSNAEIQKVVEYTEFKEDEKDLEYARDIWLLLYRMNGINFGDLLRMRWDNISGDYIRIIRKKTETTRKNNINEISIPVSPKLRTLIEKVGMKESPFILGLLHEGYSDLTFENKNHKMRGVLNKSLNTFGKKLELSVPLKLKTARDSYATTLKRGGRSIEEISEMLGHANPQTSSHYLASLDIEKTHKINEILF